MLEPLVKSIEVPCDKETAFNVFVQDMGSWWPLGKFTISAMGGSPAVGLRVESKAGGEIVELGPDGAEHFWGRFLEYDPHDFLSMDFHITRPDMPRGDGSLVEVRFTELDPDRTHVELTQSKWEVFGDMAKAVYGGYGHGWDMIFGDAYRLACGG